MEDNTVMETTEDLQDPQDPQEVTINDVSNSQGDDPIVVQVDAVDYTEQLTRIEELLSDQQEQYEAIVVHMEDIKADQRSGVEFSGTIAGFGLFAVIIVLCRYIYKFFRIFF